MSERQTGEPPAAARFGPARTDADFQRATELHLQGRLPDAERLYQRILKTVPDHFDALHLLGVLKAQTGNGAAGAELIGKALALNPGDAAAHSNLGNVFLSLARFEDAVGSCERALALRPDFADAHANRGIALRALGRFEEALASFDCALEYSPDDSATHNNRAVALRALGRFEEALASCERAVALTPDYADAHINRGAALRALGRLEEALASCDRALALRPESPEALNSRGGVLCLLKRFEEAAGSYEKLLDVAPDYRYAAGNYWSSKGRACHWLDFEAARRAVVQGVEQGKLACLPFAFLSGSHSPAEQLKCAQIHVRSDHPPSPRRLVRGDPYRHDRIRIAYLSSDFHVHPTAFLMAGLFERHDRTRFETIAISYGPNQRGPMRTRLERAFDRFIDVRDRSALEIARLIRELEVDIAIDCKGFTQDSRPEILGFRPAPVQAQYLGYPGSMGAEYIDYILADRFVIPEDHRKFYAEKVVYLPDSYQVNDSDRHISLEVLDREASGLPADGFVFCCFNQHYKITPQVFDLWMRLLRDVEGSVLWLVEDNADSGRNLRSEASSRGVAPERIVFAPRLEQSRHLARHRLADLFIDTLPYNAHTSASDALWAGLPIVTCCGTTFAGRVATSLLNAVGLPQLAAPDLAAYEELARALATDPTRLNDVKARLRQNRSNHPLFDTDRFRRHLEQAYITMWERYQRQEPPESFSVAARD